MKTRFLAGSLGVLFLVLLAFLPLSGAVEDTLNRSFPVHAGGKLIMDVNRGSIEIATHGENTVKVMVIQSVNTNDEEKAQDVFAAHEVDMHISGDDVTIESEFQGSSGVLSWLKGKQLTVRYMIAVPVRYNLELKTSGGSIQVNDIDGQIDVRTSGGSLVFANVKGKVNARTSGGSIQLQSCSGDVNVNTSGGNIQIGRVDGKVNAHTSGGSIKVTEVMGAIDATTSGGSISVFIARQPRGNCKLTTSGGSIKVQLADDLKVNIDAKTSNGLVQTNLRVNVRGEIGKTRLKGEINGGGPRLYLRTTGGGIKISNFD